MISVAEAQERLLALVAPLDAESVPITAAAGRVLASDVAADRDQPPFAASAMDGYAVRAEDIAPGARFKVIGEAAAGHGSGLTVGPGEALRIFTGAPLPAGADAVILQEDVTRDGDTITLTGTRGEGSNVRPAGNDFRKGDAVRAPRRLGPSDIALLASMNHGVLPVRRRPEIALIATGDELVMPGETPGPDQIIASNTLGLKALFEEMGAAARLLPIARDTAASLRMAFELARGADLVVTVGGASVGDHDLVAPVAAEMGMDRAFYKVRMRPGKPLMAGRLEGAAMVGLPGNPVSAMVCGHVFIAPMIRRMLGLDDVLPAPRRAPLAEPVGENGPREHYQRATLGAEGLSIARRQDSALLGVLAGANALVIRPPGDPARAVGEMVDYLPI